MGSGRMAVPELRVKALSDFVQPTTKRGMKRFLGCIGYYRRFIEGFAQHSALLTPSTSRTALDCLRWTDDTIQASLSLCESLCKHVVLCVPCTNDIFTPCTDASRRRV